MHVRNLYFLCSGDCVFNGVTYPHGAEFPAGDGCNTWCECTHSLTLHLLYFMYYVFPYSFCSNGQVGCTEIFCPPGLCNSIGINKQGLQSVVWMCLYILRHIHCSCMQYTSGICTHYHEIMHTSIEACFLHLSTCMSLFNSTIHLEKQVCTVYMEFEH